MPMLHRGLTRALVTVVTLALGISLHSQGAPEDYLQWRGHTRDGAASAFVEPASWPARLVRRWQVEVGEGYATPLLVGDTVYTFTRRSGREVASALDVRTGTTRWQTGYDLAYMPSDPTAVHGAGPKATPVVQDGTLVTVGVSGIVSAFDTRDGRRLWQTAAPAEVPYFSAAASPLAVGDLILTHPGNYEPLTAFDRRSGRVRWTAGAGGFFMSPVLATFAGVSQVITVTQAGVIGVDVATGQVLWEHPWMGGRLGGITPVVHGDTVVVSASMSGVKALRPARRERGWSVDVVWETADASMYISNPVVIDDVLYGLSERAGKQLVALDIKDGTILWRGPGREADGVAFVHAGRTLFLLKDSAELVVARPSRTSLNPLAHYAVADSATWAQPVFSGRRILVKDASTLTLWTAD